MGDLRGERSSETVRGVLAPPVGEFLAEQHRFECAVEIGCVLAQAERSAGVVGEDRAITESTVGVAQEATQLIVEYLRCELRYRQETVTTVAAVCAFQERLAPLGATAPDALSSKAEDSFSAHPVRHANAESFRDARTARHLHDARTATVEW
jgi:hypothetical protein